MSQKITITVNGHEKTIESDPERPLLNVLREDLQLTGSKYGCGEGLCGACSVLLGDKRVFSCSTPVKFAAGKTVTTIEGLSQGDMLHPVQQAFYDCEAYQCGYCTPGMIMAAVALLKTKPKPTEVEIINAMNGNLCRCCGYPRILNAVRQAAGLEGR
jgi:aerobic-type carbon monoxide dehydrogenase small subunit (CoxS/CutS family)